MRKASRARSPKTNRDKNPDAYVKVPISLPQDIHKFADGRALAISKDSGEPKNFSKYIRDLVREDKQRTEAAKA